MKIIRNFLTIEELSILRRIAKTCDNFTGTRPGIYECSTIYRIGDSKGMPEELYNKFLNASGLTPPLKGRSIHQFISYETGGFIHAHKDWVDPNCKLYRINVMVDAPIKGGECFVDGEEVKLNEGDAIVLRAELQEHEVKPILEGSRMIFTIGFHHKEAE